MVQKAVRAKLPDGVRVGDVITKNPVYEFSFETYGTVNRSVKKDRFGYVSGQQINRPDVLQRNYVLVEELEGAETGVVTAVYFQDLKQGNARGWCNIVQVFYELCISDFRRLKEDIKRYPDIMEALLQSAFPGIDAQGESRHGLRRVPSEGFFVYEGPDDINMIDHLDRRRGNYKLDDLFTDRPFYRYSSAYGTGDPV